MVAQESIANEAATTLSGAITAGAASITVASAAGFPSAPFRIRVSGNLTAGGTGTEYMLVTAVAGTTWTVTRAAEIPWNTALGFATDATVKQVVTVHGIYDALGLVDVKNPRYAGGAKGDGATDNAAAIAAAFLYASTLGVVSPDVYASSGTGGATVIFGPGDFRTSTSLNQPSRVKIKGAGINATILRRTANVPLLTIYGTDTWFRNWYASIEDMTVHGGDFGANLVDCIYASQMRITNVMFFGVAGRALNMVACWDSNIRGCFLEWVGGVANTSLPAIHIRNSQAASGFGWSDDNSNELRFTDCHLEQFRSGAFRIEQGTSNTNEPNGIYITNFKMENYYISGNAPFVYVAPEANRVHLEKGYMWAGGLLDGTAINVIHLESVKQCTVRDVFLGSPATPTTVLNGVYVNVSATSSGLTVLDSIYGSYGVAPTAHVNVNSHSALQVANLRTNLGPLLLGYEIDSALRKKSLTSAITNTSTTAANITQLTFSNVQPGSYQLEMDGMDQSSVTTAGARFGVGGTATISTIGGFITQQTSATAGTTTEITAANSTFGTNPAGTGALRVSMSVGVTVTAVGTLGIRWNQSAASTGTLRVGTNVTLTRVA